MSRSLSWIDPKTLQSALSRSHEAPGAGRTQAGRFEAPSAPVTDEPQVNPTVVDPMPDRSPGISVETPIADRIQSLATWIDSQLSPQRWYISDSEGLALHVSGASQAQVITAVALSKALRPLRSVLGPQPVQSVTLQLGDGRMMHILWCETLVGRVALAMENPQNASQERLGMLADALRQAMNGQGTTP